MTWVNTESENPGPLNLAERLRRLARAATLGCFPAACTVAACLRQRAEPLCLARTVRVMEFSVKAALLLGLTGLAFALPAIAQGSDTLKEVIAKGIVLGTGGSAIQVTYKADGTFSAMGGQITGKWRIDGDKLCSSTEATTEDCVLYPRGKKSGDSFATTGARGTTSVTIK